MDVEILGTGARVLNPVLMDTCMSTGFLGLVLINPSSSSGDPGTSIEDSSSSIEDLTSMKESASSKDSCPIVEDLDRSSRT